MVDEVPVKDISQPKKEKKNQEDDEDIEESKLSWWENKMLMESEEHTHILRMINTAVQIVGVIVLLLALLAACSALRLI